MRKIESDNRFQASRAAIRGDGPYWPPPHKFVRAELPLPCTKLAFTTIFRPTLAHEALGSFYPIRMQICERRVGGIRRPAHLDILSREMIPSKSDQSERHGKAQQCESSWGVGGKAEVIAAEDGRAVIDSPDSSDASDRDVGDCCL